MRARADFQWRLAEIDDQRAVLIVDNDMGNMSVTNDAEAVLEEINGKLIREIDEGTLVFYRDSQGQWDRMITTNDGTFTGFAFADPDLREKLARTWGRN